jgi:segregation and condensation protein A
MTESPSEEHSPIEQSTLPGVEETQEEQPKQEEMPFAFVYGKAVTKLPQDLYIPPDALEVFLEAFEGPLDLLLYLIKRQNLDILDIKVSQITEQYMGYVELMKSLNLELAAEYLVMAALLSEIKSRSLLPRPKDDEGEETDPRAELIRRLQEYERFKKAAEDLDDIPRVGRDIFVATANPPEYQKAVAQPDVDMKELLLALQEILVRADMFESHQIQKEKLSTRERMSQVLDSIRGVGFVSFYSLFTLEEGRVGVVVTFLAVLELVKESLIELVQNEPFAPIHIRAQSGATELSRDFTSSFDEPETNAEIPAVNEELDLFAEEQADIETAQTEPLADKSNLSSD